MLSRLSRLSSCRELSRIAVELSSWGSVLDGLDDLAASRPGVDAEIKKLAEAAETAAETETEARCAFSLVIGPGLRFLMLLLLLSCFCASPVPFPVVAVCSC